jgi:hypothetical protein
MAPNPHSQRTAIAFLVLGAACISAGSSTHNVPPTAESGGDTAAVGSRPSLQAPPETPLAASGAGPRYQLSATDSAAIHVLQQAISVAEDSVVAPIRLQQALDDALMAARQLTLEQRLRDTSRTSLGIRHEVSIVVSILATRTASAWLREAEGSRRCEPARAAMNALDVADRHWQHCRACPAAYEQAMLAAFEGRNAGRRLIRTLCGGP